MAVIYQARQARCSLPQSLNLCGRVGHSGAGVDAGNYPVSRFSAFCVGSGVASGARVNFKIAEFVLPRLAEVRRCFGCAHLGGVVRGVIELPFRSGFALVLIQVAASCQVTSFADSIGWRCLS